MEVKATSFQNSSVCYYQLFCEVWLYTVSGQTQSPKYLPWTMLCPDTNIQIANIFFLIFSGTIFLGFTCIKGLYLLVLCCDGQILGRTDLQGQRTLGFEASESLSPSWWRNVGRIPVIGNVWFPLVMPPFFTVDQETKNSLQSGMGP